MKKYKYISLLALLLALVTGACSKENFGDETSGKGQLSFKQFLVSIADGSGDKAPSRQASVDDVVVDIINSEGVTVQSYRYAEMPSVVELPVGTYHAVAHLGANPDGEFEAPYYKGESDDFTIRKDDITSVETIVCHLANVKVTIIYSEDLKAAMSADAKVNVVVGSKGNLDFVRDEPRSGYFAYVEGSNTLAATFEGAVNGTQETSSKVYTDVAPGTHYRISYTLHKPGSDPSAGGNIVPGLMVDAQVELVDINWNYDDDDDDRPGGGDRPGEGDDPNPTDDPVVTINDPLSFDQVNTVTPESQVMIQVDSEKGITLFQVDIISDTLNEEVLTGVGLTTHLDLVNPGQFEEGISSLGLPVNVGGQHHVDFNISSFMPLLAIYGDNTHQFRLTVSSGGTPVVRTLKLHMVP